MSTSKRVAKKTATKKPAAKKTSAAPTSTAGGPPAVRRAPTQSPWAKVRRSPIHGRGVIATKDIPSGTRIIEYEGERITKAESERRDNARAERAARGGDGCVYIFDVNKRYDLDGHMAWNTARLINHSCDPNCESENVRGHIWITAKRDIAAGEELTFDYGFDVSNWRDHPCRCGSKKCVGYIVAKSQRWRLRKLLAKARREERKT